MTYQLNLHNYKCYYVLSASYYNITTNFKIPDFLKIVTIVTINRCYVGFPRSYSLNIKNTIKVFLSVLKPSLYNTTFIR